MTTLGTTDDLLRAARENQEFRDAFRREILTEELISAPGDIKELKEIAMSIVATGEALNQHAATTNQQLEIMAASINSLHQVTEANAKGISDLVNGIADMNRDLSEKIDGVNREIGDKIEGLDQKIDGVNRDLNEKIDGVNRDLSDKIEGLDQKIDGVNRDLSDKIEGTNRKIDSVERNLGDKIEEIGDSHIEEHIALHRFRGNYAIEATQNSDGDIAELFAKVRGINRYRLRTLTRKERDDLFDDNLDSIDLLDTEGNISKSFPAGDLIAVASYRRSGDTIFYIAVEASYTVNANDVIRASDHAKILREVTGREAFAIVSGVRVNPRIGNFYRQRIVEDLTEYLESKQDDVVFWFQLADSSLEPPPPR